MQIQFEYQGEEHSVELHSFANRKFKAAFNALVLGQYHDPTAFIKSIDDERYNDNMDMGLVARASVVARDELIQVSLGDEKK